MNLEKFKILHKTFLNHLDKKEIMKSGSVASNVRKNQIFYIYNKKDVQRALFS